MDIWLVVLTILKNMKVNGKDDIPYIMENNPNDWNHQPLWLFNIAMENGQFIDGLPIRNGDFPWLC